MEKQMTQQEAWEDFWQNVVVAQWKSLTRDQRHELRQADRAQRGKVFMKGKQIHLGTSRFKRILEEYAPNRYRFEVYTNIYKIEDTEAP